MQEAEQRLPLLLFSLLLLPTPRAGLVPYLWLWDEYFTWVNLLNPQYDPTRVEIWALPTATM